MSRAGAILLCGMTAGWLSAQHPAHLSGLVADPSGAGVPDTEVSIVNLDNGFRRATRTQASGVYLAAYLQPGRYRITVRKDGFRTSVRSGVKLEAGLRTQADFALTIGQMHEVVTVNTNDAPVRMEGAPLGTVVSREWLDRLPLQGRGLLSVLELAPATLATPATRGEPGQFSAAGQRPNANYFTVDGLSVNSGVSGGGTAAQVTGGTLPGLTALGSYHGLIPLEALDEFQILTSNATAEFGRLPGAQVSLSSRAGSRQMHGSAFGYLRNGRLDARDWFASRASTARLGHYGGSLSGPVGWRRTFFFGAHESLGLREPFALRGVTPVASARAAVPEWLRPALALMPAATGAVVAPGVAEWRAETDRQAGLNVTSLRIDQPLGARVSAFGRYNLSTSHSALPAMSWNDLAVRSVYWTGGVSVVATPSVVLDLRASGSDFLGRSYWRPPAEASLPCGAIPNLPGSASYCGSLVRISIGGVGQSVSGPEGDRRQRQWNVLPAVVWASPNHQLRVGFDYRRSDPERLDARSTISIIAESMEDLREQPRVWAGTAEARRVRGTLQEYAWFAHDTWRVASGLTASVGLRWEHPLAPALPASRGPILSTEAYAFPGQSDLWRRGRGYLAPRLGLAWKTGGGLTLRGGRGLHYNSSLGLAADLVNDGPLTMTQFLNPRNAPFSTLLSFGFEPNLRLPAARLWNVTAERELFGGDLISASYVGSGGQNLIRREFGAYEQSATLWLALATNRGESAYHGAQLQYRRPLRQGVQLLASYAWAHSIDNSSSDSQLYWVGPGAAARRDRASSDFDARHSMTLGFGLAPAIHPGREWWRKAARGWSMDGMARARTGFPLTVVRSEYALGVGFANAFRPGFDPAQPVWLTDGAAPGGRRLNAAAFPIPDPAAGSAPGQGVLGRNAITGLGMAQIDMALRREFRVAEGHSLSVRVEAFNALNQANFADPIVSLAHPLFGRSQTMLNRMLGTGSPGSGLTPMLQSGGPRALQFVLRYRF